MSVASVRVAKYFPGKKYPKMEGYKTILIHVKNKSLGGGLSPYQLKTKEGYLLENVWQFSKVYEKVTRQRIPKSRWQPEIIWEHDAEVHVDDQGNLTEEYFKWRQKGYENEYAVRYPNGYRGRANCLYSFWDNEKLSYVESRKKVYCKLYRDLAPENEDFKKLKTLLENGTNLLIVEVDGPSPSENYGPYKKISMESPGMEMTEETVRFLIKDTQHPFGHGFVIASLLMGGESWLE